MTLNRSHTRVAYYMILINATPYPFHPNPTPSTQTSLAKKAEATQRMDQIENKNHIDKAIRKSDKERRDLLERIHGGSFGDANIVVLIKIGLAPSI